MLGLTCVRNLKNQRAFIFSFLLVSILGGNYAAPIKQLLLPIGIRQPHPKFCLYMTSQILRGHLLGGVLLRFEVAILE